MTYFRLRDIKTPPFAYVTNKEEVIRVCRSCDMPFDELCGPLEVEICSIEGPEKYAAGKPLLADLWLVGDDQFAEKLESLVPGSFKKAPVSVRASSPGSPHLQPVSSQLQQAPTNMGQRPFFSFKPVCKVTLDKELSRQFPPIPCPGCRREIPEIPFDFHPLPLDETARQHVAALQDFHWEGYDYLFHEEIAAQLETCFPEMILERLVGEPAPI